jgi:hypothetical protein
LHEPEVGRPVQVGHRVSKVLSRSLKTQIIVCT